MGNLASLTGLRAGQQRLEPGVTTEVLQDEQQVPVGAGVGLVLLAVGLGLALWARVHIRRNWGTPMKQKDEPEMVTGGPYRPVRHPIYSVILLAASATQWR